MPTHPSAASAPARWIRGGWLLALCAVLAPAAAAAEWRLHVGGFGTLGALYHNDAGLEYRRAITQGGSAAAGKLDVATDTRAGVQLNAAWSHALALIAQVVTRDDAHHGWQPQLSRALVHYSSDGILSVRAGRIGWEILPHGDSRDVGYAQLRIRPETEVFGTIPAETFDGAEATLQWPLPLGVLGARVYGGRTSDHLADADGNVSRVDAKLWGAHLDYAHGPWVLRLGSGVFALDQAARFDELVAGLRQTGEPRAQALAERLASRERKTVFVVLGGNYDDGRWQARALLARAEHDGISAPNTHRALLTLGYDLGALTPFVSLSAIDSFDHVQGTGLPDTPEYTALNAGAAAVQRAFQQDQSSLALGLRWDFRPRRALKVQADHVWLRGSTVATDARGTPDGSAEMTVLGIALDFVF